MLGNTEKIKKPIESFDKGSNWLTGLVSLPHFAENAFDLMLVSAVINILTLALPLTLMQVYDRIIPNSGISTLTWLLIGCSVALLLEAILRVCRAFIINWMAARFEHLVGCSTVEKILASRLPDFEKDEVGVHLDRFSAVSTLRGFYAGQVFQILLDVPFAALFLLAIWYLAGGLVFFPVSIVIFYFILIYFFRIGFHSSRREQITINDRRSNFIIELLESIHLAKAMTFEEEMLRRYERLQASGADTNLKVTFWGMLPSNVGVLLSQITMFGLIGLGAMDVIGGTLTVGGLTACTLLGGRALQPIQSAAGFWLRFSDAEIAHSKLQKIATMEDEVESGSLPFPDDIEGTVELKNVSYKFYSSETLLLDDVNLKVVAKETIGIMGQDSVRTTSLLCLMLGILKPESGIVLIDDFDISKWDHSNLRGRIEYLPQTGTLFNGTILENISMFDENRTAAALDAAALLKLDDHIANLPMGYETQTGSQAASFLPSGLIQRICIARALVLRPRILLFDRTNSAMDQESLEIFHSLLEYLKNKCTMVMVTNQPNLLTLADTVYEVVGDTLEDLF
ncbi:MAG: ATP-binding cassette domain-containing protein [SAR324 cluster bacterium]|nr:ATP-binding cassette domain-containing protein [SAR324 cluster bacterium]